MENGKIQFKMWVNSISSKYFYETYTIHSVSNDIEIVMGSETDSIIDEPFKSLLQRYQKEKEESNEKGDEFVLKVLISCIYIFKR